MNSTSKGKFTVIHTPLSSAYLLVSHGSRDPRPQAALEQLATLIGAKVGNERVNNSTEIAELKGRSPSFSSLAVSNALVGTACLELATLPLHEQIKQFSQKALAAGYSSIQVLPLFLLPGVHVKEDIPEEVLIAQNFFGPKLKIELRPHLGSHPGLVDLLATQLTNLPTTRILLAHGSRRLDANQSVEAIANQLDALAAYWARSPKLEYRINELISAGCKQIGIIPYFLFSGGITDAIAQNVQLISKQFPSASFHLAEPIGPSEKLVDLIWNLIIK